MYKKSLIAISALAMLSSSSLADTTNLSDVVVTAKSNKSIDDISSTVTVITAEEIEKMNATNISDILVKTPGIIKTVANRSTGGRENFSIRGLDSNYSLILVDGKKISPTDDYIGHSNFEYSWVSPSMIERIEIIKGPQSSIYGSQAIGGVVNIITKKNSRKFFGDIDVQGGKSSAKNGGNEYKASVNIGGNISDKLFLYVGANKTERKATGGNGYDMTRMRTFIPTNKATYVEGVDSKDVITKLKYNIDDTQNIYASYLRSEEDRLEYNKKISYDMKKDSYSFGYEKSFNDVSLNIDYSNSKTDIKSDTIFSKTDYVIKIDSLKGEAKISSLKNNYIVLGAETSNTSYDRKPVVGRAPKDIKTNSFYIQDEIELGNFIFSLGGRYDDNERFGNRFSPNVGALYKIDDKQRIKLSYAEGFKAPSVHKATTGFGNGRHGSAFGNDNLKAETSRSYELAYEYYGQDTVLKTAIFKTDLKNKIATERRGRLEYYINKDQVEAKGFEASIKHDFNENHSINTNYTFVKTEDKKKKEELTYKPKHNINVGLSSKFAYGISTYLSANYVAEQMYEDVNQRRKKASSYTIFNAQVSKQLAKNLDLRVGVDNITNKSKVYDSEIPYYLKERVIYAGLKYKF